MHRYGCKLILHYIRFEIEFNELHRFYIHAPHLHTNKSFVPSTLAPRSATDELVSKSLSCECAVSKVFRGSVQNETEERELAT